jgi:hypothetical protein
VVRLILPSVALVAFLLAALLPWRAARLLVVFVPAVILFIGLASSEFCDSDKCVRTGADAVIGLVAAVAWLAVTGAGVGVRALAVRIRSHRRRGAAAL